MPWRWAIEPGDRGVERVGVGELPARHSEKQQALGCEEPVDERVGRQVIVE
jgi:hypothetical protein